MRFLFSFLISLFLSPCLFGQTYLTKGSFTWSVEKDITYAYRTNYVGITDTLRLDLYKPIGNFCPERPLMVLVHGGSWLGGCKEGISWLAEEMVSRGYVVANVNYRLGWHKQEVVAVPCGTQDFPDVFPNAYDALYPADSCEIIRAIYRGQQDVKSAIRWLQDRHIQDSTSLDAILVGGESAGGFLALATGFLDQENEKPACCFDLDPAPVPYSPTANITTLNCLTQNWTVDTDARERPDLGSVNGQDDFGGQYDAKVLGIASLYGGVPYVALTDNWVGGPDTPAIYMYHQSCDAIVPFIQGKPFYPLSGVCNGFANCSPWHHNLATVFGNGGLANYFASLSNPPNYTTDFTSCPPFDTNLGILSCFYFADNGSFHFTANKPLRAENMSTFFYPLVTEIVGMPCSTGNGEIQDFQHMQPIPNPFREYLSVNSHTSLPGKQLFRLYNLRGEQVWEGKIEIQTGINILSNQLSLPAGTYVLQWVGNTTQKSWMVQHVGQ
ncbi:MAG: hypothetical protein R2792_18555 [Saprospiraceae bacterium]